MKKSKKVMALILALSMVIMSGTLAFADAGDSVTASETGNTVQTGDQKLEHEHNQVTVDQACAACNGTGKVTTTETEQIGSDADVNLITEVKEIETDCTACGGNGTIQSEKSCYGKFVKVAEKSVAPTTEADGCDYYECVICNANYKETVVKLETPNPCENPIHDKKKNVHNTCITFYDEDGNQLKSSGAFSGSKWFGVPDKDAYNTDTFVDAENMSHYFEGWYDEAGNEYVGTSKYVASETECQDIRVFPKWDVQAPCTNPLHDTKKNNHMHSIVFIDQNEESFHNEWHQEYGRASWSARDTAIKRSIQGFTSDMITHNQGIYYYEFLGWFTEDEKCIATQEDWNAEKQRYDLKAPVTVPASNKCEEVKVYAKWKEHRAPLLQFYVIDKVTPFGNSFENTDGRITCFSHTFFNPIEENPEHSNGYKFFGFVEVDESGTQSETIYQPGDTYTVDMTNFSDDTVTVKKIYAKWQPSVTVNYIADGQTIGTTGEMYDDYSVATSAPEAPSKEGYNFVGWVDENGNTINEVKALGIITIGERVEAKVVNIYAKYEPVDPTPTPDPVIPTPVVPTPDPVLPVDPVDPQPLPPDDPLIEPVDPQPLPPDDPLIEPEDPKQPLPEDDPLIEEPEDPDQPKTGDEAPLTALAGLLFASAGALGTIYIRRRKTDK